MSKKESKKESKKTNHETATIKRYKNKMGHTIFGPQHTENGNKYITDDITGNVYRKDKLVPIKNFGGE